MPGGRSSTDDGGTHGLGTGPATLAPRPGARAVTEGDVPTVSAAQPESPSANATIAVAATRSEVLDRDITHSLPLPTRINRSPTRDGLPHRPTGIPIVSPVGLYVIRGGKPNSARRTHRLLALNSGTRNIAPPAPRGGGHRNAPLLRQPLHGGFVKARIRPIRRRGRSPRRAPRAPGRVGEDEPAAPAFTRDPVPQPARSDSDTRKMSPQRAIFTSPAPLLRSTYATAETSRPAGRFHLATHRATPSTAAKYCSQIRPWPRSRTPGNRLTCGAALSNPAAGGCGPDGQPRRMRRSKATNLSRAQSPSTAARTSDRSRARPMNPAPGPPGSASIHAKIRTTGRAAKNVDVRSV